MRGSRLAAMELSGVVARGLLFSGGKGVVKPLLEEPGRRGGVGTGGLRRRQWRDKGADFHGELFTCMGMLEVCSEFRDVLTASLDTMTEILICSDWLTRHSTAAWHGID
jgi:hypothetical protein